jgi:predicted polyphosphate/ATP-dependent NAD kinase
MPAPLLVDTGDPQLDRELSGYVRVITGFEEYVSHAVRC